ncbi:hypothetical protein HK101_004865, partial [Irineochytrium annulatum]
MYLTQLRPSRSIYDPVVRPPSPPPLDATPNATLPRPPSRFDHIISLHSIQLHEPDILTKAPNLTIAYAVMVHDAGTIAGAVDLIALLHTPHDHFLIHVDAKVPDANHSALAASYAGWPNVHVLRESYMGEWGSVELVMAELALLNAAVALPNATWGLFLLLDGTSFPLHPPHVLRTFLQPFAASRRNLVFDDKTRVKTCHSMYVSALNVESCNFHRGSCADWGCNTLHRTPGGMHVWKGSQWIILHRDFADYVVHDPVARDDWTAFFGGSFASDEMYFPTVIMNSPFANSTEDGEAGIFEYMFKIWSTYGCRSYAPPRRHGVGPCWLGDGDKEEVAEAARKGFLFTRKLRDGEKLREDIVR